MFTYNIAQKADNKAFKDVCNIIENGINNLTKERPLVDVDGTVIQIYLKNNKRIKVYNDYEVDAVYVDSEMDLKNIIRAS